MKLFALSLSAALIAANMAFAADLPALKVKVKGIDNNAAIPKQFAYCAPSESGKTRDSNNINPAIEWSGAPAGTKSFAIIVVDRDVPATFELANQDGKTIPADFPRQDFYHWVLVDVPANMVALSEGADSNGIVVGGKNVGPTKYGINGQNDYAKVYGGNFGGYDGPCPPWNDMRMHNYHFIVRALDVETLGLSGLFGGKQAEELMQGHILASGEVVGTYTNNKSAR